MGGKAQLRKKVDALLYNLFRETPKDLKLLRMQEINEDAWVMSTNFNATVKLMRYQEKIDTEIDRETKDFIESSLKLNPNDIHAWINKAMYNILSFPSDLDQAKEDYDKASELHKNESSALEAKFQYAFWLCTMMNDDLKKRKEGIEIFREELRTRESDPRHHYLYMKVLGIHLNRLPQDVDKSERQEIAKQFKHQIERLYYSESPGFQMQMFLYLADVQRHDTGKIILDELQNLDLPFGRPNIKFCILKIKQILESNKENKSIKRLSNFYARIGLCLLKDAWQGNPDELEKNLDTALSYATKYEDCPSSRVPMGAITCARIILAQWAVKYYAANQDKLQHIPYQDKRKYLAEVYHTKDEDTNEETRSLLMKALRYLKEHLKRGGPFVAEYPRVLILLGEDPNTVTPAYDRESGGIPIDRIKRFEHKGLFCEVFGQFEEAKRCWKEVQKIVKDELIAYTSFIAIHGLKRLATRQMDRRPDCERSDNWRIR